MQHHVPETVVDTAVSPYLGLRADGVVVWASASVAELLGFDPVDLVGRAFVDLMSEASRPFARNALGDIGRFVGPGPRRPWRGRGFTGQFTHRDEAAVWCEVSFATPTRTGLDHYVLQLRRAEADVALHSLLRAISRGDDATGIQDRVGRFVEACITDTNVEIARSVGAKTTVHGDGPLRRIRDRSWLPMPSKGETIVLGPDEVPHIVHEAAVGLGRPTCWVVGVGPSRNAAIVVWTVEGAQLTTLYRQHLYEGAQLCAVALRSIADRELLEVAADTDALTTLPNRRGLLRRVPDDHADRRCAVLFLDLEDFKMINDVFGHSVGDQVLVITAQRLARVLRADDVLARIGGDEFIIVTDADQDLGRLQARLVDAVSAPIELASIPDTVQIGMTIGTSLATGADTTLSQLIDRADATMRRAKLERVGRYRPTEADA